MISITAANDEIEVLADWAQPSSLIQFRSIGGKDWSPSVYKVADAREDPEYALELVCEWLDMQYD